MLRKTWVTTLLKTRCHNKHSSQPKAQSANPTAEKKAQRNLQRFWLLKVRKNSKHCKLSQNHVLTEAGKDNTWCLQAQSKMSNWTGWLKSLTLRCLCTYTERIGTTAQLCHTLLPHWICSQAAHLTQSFYWMDHMNCSNSANRVFVWN